MAVLRKIKKTDFTVIDNNIFKNKKLSIKGKGMICTMLSLPDDWDFSEDGLTNLSNDGKASIRSTLKELMEFGYLKRTRNRDEKGILRDYVYTIYEEPTLENQKLEPNCDYPTLEKPTLENRNTNKILNNKELNNKRKKEIYKEKKETYGIYGRVKLTIDEYLKLVNEFGEEFIKNQIDLLDEYVESNNNKNKYTNFNLVLRKSIRENWFKRKNKITTRDLDIDFMDIIEKGARK